MFGECGFEKGDLKLTIGTGGFIDIMTGNKCLACRNNLYPVLGWKIGDEVTYMLEGSFGTVGNMIDWIVNNMKFVNDYNELNKIDREDGKGTDIYFVNAFDGIETPFFDDSARALFVGINLKTTKGDVVRSVLESVGYHTKILIDCLEKDAKIKTSTIYIDGGVSKNDYILQFVADITGRKVLRPVQLEMTCLGAAFIAGIKCGYWKDKEELKKIKEIDRVFEPNMDEEEREKRIYYYDEALKRSFKWNVESLEKRQKEMWWDNWKQRLNTIVMIMFFGLLYFWFTGRLILSFG